MDVVSTLAAGQVWREDIVLEGTDVDRDQLEFTLMSSMTTLTRTSQSPRSPTHRNELGSVVAVSSASEAIVATSRYSPFGMQTILVAGTPVGGSPRGSV